MRDEARFFRGGLPHPPKRFISTGETVAEAAARIGVKCNTIRMRLRYGWTEGDALSLPPRPGHRPYPRAKGKRRGARPGVKHGPINKMDVTILGLLAEGFTLREIFEAGLAVSLHALQMRVDRIRFKLDAFTTAQMMVLAVKRGLIQSPSGGEKVSNCTCECRASAGDPRGAGVGQSSADV